MHARVQPCTATHGFFAPVLHAWHGAAVLVCLLRARAGEAKLLDDLMLKSWRRFFQVSFCLTNGGGKGEIKLLFSVGESGCFQ